MKAKAWWLCIFLALFATSQVRLAAQSCFTFSDDYAVYLDESTDGTNIYTSVLLDGNGTMNITGGEGCSSINYSSAVHTPIAVNVIATGSSYVGGAVYGSPECPTCYLSVTNNQSLAATPGVAYSFTADGEVNCSFAGQIFGIGWPNIQVEIAYTKSI